ncbi:hypothetical protein GX411_06890 [Candidatus Fermentibacteria bacterium]|nr:hypothetical protein [Candidatus Fermentibacteria bacterium]
MFLPLVHLSLLCSINSAPLWEVPAGAPARGAPLLVETSGGMSILLPLGDRGLAGFDGHGEPLPGFPVSTVEGVSFRPAGFVSSSGRSLAAYVDDAGGAHLVDLSGAEQPGWPVSLGINPVTGVTALDLDLDGSMEIAVGTADSKIHLLDETGAEMPGWPVSPGARLEWQPAQVSMGGGESGAMVCLMGNAQATLLDMTGRTLPGWPVSPGFAFATPAVCADIDSDGLSDIIFATRDRRLHAFGTRGFEIRGWPVLTDARAVGGGLAVGPAGAAGGLPSVAVACEDSLVYLFDHDGSLAGAWRWPNRVDALPTSPIMACASTGVAVMAAADDGTVHAWDAEGRYIESMEAMHGEGVQYAPAVGDIDGDGRIELVAAGRTGLVAAWRLPSTEEGPWPQQLSDSRNTGSYGLCFLSSAQIENLTGEFTGDVEVGYRIVGGTASGVSLAYSTDAGYSWKSASSFEDLGGRLIWHSREDIGSSDETDCLLRVTPLGGSGAGIAGISTIFHVDNNEPPVIYLSPPGQMPGGVFAITYAVDDPEADTIQLQAQFSRDGGASWQTAHLEGSTIFIEPWLYGSPVTWDYRSDTGMDDPDSLLFRMRAADEDPGPWSVLQGTSVATGRSQSGQVVAPVSEVSGGVRLWVRPAEVLQEDPGFEYEFSLDGGTTWSPATISPAEGGVGVPGQFDVVWESSVDAPGVDTRQARVRALDPSGTLEAVPVPSAPFHLDNNAAPSVSILSPGRYSVFEGLVPVRFLISDPEGDEVTVLVQYRMPGDTSWITASGVLANGPFGPAQYSGTLEWNSSADLPGGVQAEIELRLVAVDSDSASSPLAGPIALNNRTLPFTVQASLAENDASRGVATVRFELSDPENRPLSLAASWSGDGGRTWRAASVSGDVTGITGPAYLGRIEWDYVLDAGSEPARLLFRLTPVSGGVSGFPRTLELQTGN